MPTVEGRGERWRRVKTSFFPCPFVPAAALRGSAMIVERCLRSTICLLSRNMSARLPSSPRAFDSSSLRGVHRELFFSYYPKVVINDARKTGLCIRKCRDPQRNLREIPRIKVKQRTLFYAGEITRLMNSTRRFFLKIVHGKSSSWLNFSPLPVIDN